jgi:hypothetical protein
MFRQLIATYFIFLAICLLPIFLFAQIKDSARTGEIGGSVKDTARNYYIQSATVSIYNAKDSSLLSYTLTNSLGKFYIGGLPVNAALNVRVSYIGYQTYSTVFTLSSEKKN